MSNTVSTELAESLASHLQRRELQCRVERYAYGRWLGMLTPLRWGMIISSTILSAIAGAGVFGGVELFGAKWKLIAGICAFAASLISGLHAAFNCDTYQEACRHLVQQFYGLEMAYQSAQVGDSERQQQQRSELDSKFEQLISQAATSPPARFRRLLVSSGSPADPALIISPPSQ